MAIALIFLKLACIIIYAKDEYWSQFNIARIFTAMRVHDARGTY